MKLQVACARDLFTKVVALIATCGALAACGGGGSSTASPDEAAPTTLSTASGLYPPRVVNVRAAYHNLMRRPHAFSLIGTNAYGVSLSAAMNISQGPKLSVRGTLMDTATVTTSVQAAGSPSVAASVAVWQELGSPDWLAMFASADASCILRTGGTPLPSFAVLGDTAPYLTGAQYSGCTPGHLPHPHQMPVGSVVQTWSYGVHGGVAFVCIDTSIFTAVGATSESDCVEVLDTNGTLGNRVRIATKDLNGVTTTYWN